MKGWLFTGTIHHEVARIGAPVEQCPREWLDEDAVFSLASETVAKALHQFKGVLRQGKWNAARGASLATYFVGQCKLQFPNIYRKWLHAEKEYRYNTAPWDPSTARRRAAPSSPHGSAPPPRTAGTPRRGSRSASPPSASGQCARSSTPTTHWAATDPARRPPRAEASSSKRARARAVAGSRARPARPHRRRVGMVQPARVVQVEHPSTRQRINPPGQPRCGTQRNHHPDSPRCGTQRCHDVPSPRCAPIAATRCRAGRT